MHLKWLLTILILLLVAMMMIILARSWWLMSWFPARQGAGRVRFQFQLNCFSESSSLSSHLSSHIWSPLLLTSSLSTSSSPSWPAWLRIEAPLPTRLMVSKVQPQESSNHLTINSPQFEISTMMIWMVRIYQFTNDDDIPKMVEPGEIRHLMYYHYENLLRWWYRDA